MNITAMVIGYGNDLRSDDGIGQRVADAIASWRLSTVKSLATHQLIPELARTLAGTELVIFVDAYLTNESSQVQVQSILPCFFSLISGHIGDPRSLLALTQANYGHCPTAWLVRVPGVNFEAGDNLSTVAETGIAIALIKIIQILDKSHNLWVNLG
jgi:hydrogenase maturation protease